MPECAFFLAANSRRGFVSFFEDFIAESFERDIYMLKGGPGCGKSTLIRRVCQPLARDGEPVEHIYCSSDPDSLDGMVLSDRLAICLLYTSPELFCGSVLSNFSGPLDS